MCAFAENTPECIYSPSDMYVLVNDYGRITEKPKCVQRTQCILSFSFLNFMSHT